MGVLNGAPIPLTLSAPNEGCRVGAPDPAHDPPAPSEVLALPQMDGLADHRPAPGAAATGTSHPLDALRRAGWTISSSAPSAAEPNTCSGGAGLFDRAVEVDEMGWSRNEAGRPIGPGGPIAAGSRRKSSMSSPEMERC